MAQSVRDDRREPIAVLTAFEMDPSRREVYVEGETDRRFLEWIVEVEKSEDARILIIDTVDLPRVEGGEKGRVLAFAEMALEKVDRIRFFVDADTDRLNNIERPANVTLTDLRDMEGYIFQHPCFDKLIRLGLLKENVRTDELLGGMLDAARRLAALHLVSDQEKLGLKFTKVSPGKYTSFKVSAQAFDFDFDRYFRRLLQASGVSLSEMSGIIALLDDKIRALAGYSDLQIVRGHDMVSMLEAVLESLDVAPKDAVRMLRCNFQREWGADFPLLMSIVAFLSN
jgi:hypothetical protein